MRRILCVAIVMSALATPAFAGMNEGVAAVTVGDYPRAIQEFEPLAAAGDAAAQYQLAKIYLEGHGPTNDVPKGVELMTQAANGNHPEAQAQLGLMYALGLGVTVDNTKAYDWLNKAVAALPDGTRRTVAESNRDAVLKRMTETGQTIAAAPTEPAAPAAAPTATNPEPAPAPEPLPAATAEPAPAPKAAAAPAPAEAVPAKTTTTEAPATKPADPAPAQVTETAKAPETKSAEATTAPAKTAETKAPEMAKAPESTKAAEPVPAPPPPDPAPTQVASAEAPDATAKDAPVVKAMGSASAQEVQSSVRVQLASMPTEEMAWDQWKKIEKKFGEQLTGLTAIVQPADLGTKGTFYRVQTGPFADKAAAEQRCTAMKEAGLDCLVIRN